MKYISLLTAAVTTILLAACSSQETATPEKSLNEQVTSILADMTLEEKIGQVIQADISAVTPDDVREYNLGSILNGGNSAPGGKVTAPPAEWIALADAFWLASTDTTDGGVGIPALWGTDAVHGHNNLQSATIFPHNIGLGAAHNPSLIQTIGEITAREVRATGIDWTFAPTLAVAKDDRWGRAYESYAEDPELVAAYAKAMVLGLQGNPSDEDFLKDDHVIATAKHFVGDGGTQFGIDKGDTLGDVEELIRVHGAGYGPAFEAGAQTVMSSFSSINGEKMHGSKTMLTDILRGQMGFSGFVVGDWDGHAEVPGCTPTDCLAAFNAGIDMYMAPNSWKGLYESLLAHAQSGKLDMDRLDEAVTRILEVKIRSGLFEAGLPSKRNSATPELLGTDSHRAVARQAVRESLVLLKNQNAALPINPTKNILLTGSGAHSMQQQTGGWTLNWQGDGNKNEDFENAQTIFSGIQDIVTASGGTATLSTDGSFEVKPDVAIVVYGEQPYAEYRGDRSDLVFEFSDGENLALIKSLKEQDIPVISVFLTGRPLWVNPHLNASDAFVVAWLPGTEGGGVGDVLFAQKNKEEEPFDFTGKLSFSWPENGIGTPINSADDPGVLFSYGFGLSYTDTSEFTTLSEDPGVTGDENFDGTIFSRGDATGSFNLYLGDSSNWNTPATALKSTSLGKGINIRGTDFKAQEDSRMITWSGLGRANVSIRPRRPLDLTDLGPLETLALVLNWRIDDPIETPLLISMECGEGCGSTLDMTSIIKDIPEDEWVETTLAVSCFVQSGLTPENISTALEITSESKATISLHSAAIKQAANNASTCPAVAN